MRVSRVPLVVQDRLQTANATSFPPTGFVALQYERSVSASLALFAVKGINADVPSPPAGLLIPSPGLWTFGEMLVHFGQGDPSRLDTTKDWVVRGEGVFKGTNVVGGSVDVPRVEFTRYTEKGQVETTSNHAPPSTKPTDSSVVSCCAYAIELFRNPFEFKGSRWTIYVDAIPILDEGVIKNYVRVPRMSRIFGISYNRSLNENQSVFNMLGMHAGGSISPLDVLGQMVVEVSASKARELNPSEPWVVDCLGTTDVVNGFGARITVPLVRFVRYYFE